MEEIVALVRIAPMAAMAPNLRIPQIEPIVRVAARITFT